MVYGFQDTNYSGQHKICQSKQYLSTEEHTENELPTVKILIRRIYVNWCAAVQCSIPELVKEIGKRKVFTGPFHPIPVFDDTTAFANTQ